MTCTTCHNPHEARRGAEGSAHYAQACRQCHSNGSHTASGDCIACHMPKRRTDDVVHAVMTDHYIQRRKPNRDLLAAVTELPEKSYRGEVVLYYPARLPQSEDTELYLATAQVMDGANLEEGVPRLARAIEKSHPKQAGFYFHLAEGYSKSSKTEEAFRMYEAALRDHPEAQKRGPARRAVPAGTGRRSGASRPSTC